MTAQVATANKNVIQKMAPTVGEMKKVVIHPLRAPKTTIPRKAGDRQKIHWLMTT